MEMHTARRSNGFGPEPIAWIDLDAWARLTGCQPRPAELRAILAIDLAWRQDDAARRKREADARKQQQR
jgi:hypothetical protein